MSVGMKAMTGIMGAYMDRDNEALRRSEAKRLQQQSQLQMESAPAENELRISQLQQQTYQTNSSLLAQQSYDAFDRFDADGDARHLNNFLAQSKNNPIGANLYGDYTRIESVATNKSPDVIRQLKAMGVQDIDGFYSDPDLAKQYVLATKADGSQEMIDLHKLHGVTGYNRHQTNRQLEEETKRAQLNRLLQTGESLNSVQQREQLIESIMANSPGMSYAQAFEQAKTIERGVTGSADVQGIQNLLKENPGMAYAEAAEQWYNLKRSGVGSASSKTDQQRFIDNYMQENPGSTYAQGSAAYANRTLTSTQKETGSVETVKQDIDSLNFGTEEAPIGFFDTDISQLSAAQRAQVHNHIAKIEDYRGMNLNTEEKRVLRDLRNLRQLGGVAGEQLTDEQTGLIDKTLNTFKSYLFNEVGGKEATSAYETFRNIFRNSLYGASLTNSEIKAFNAAAGTLGQKTKPVLAQLRTQIISIKNQLEGIRDTNDPYLAHYYVGGDIDAVDEVIRSLDERLGMLSSAAAAQSEGPVMMGDVMTTPPPAPTAPGERRPLSEIFGVPQ